MYIAEKAGVHARTQESKQRCPSSCKQKLKFNFSGSSADRILQLQRTAGNQTVQRLIKSGALQAKSRIIQPYDLYEQKARKKGTINSIRCESCKPERILQRGSINLAPKSVPPIVYEVLKSPGQPLDLGTREFMELRFGHDFSKVRVHTDTNAAKSVRDVNALAYTVGRDVVFGDGEYAPETAAGYKLLAHELTHVVQQSKSGLSLSTLKIGSSNEDTEVEASAASEQVISGNIVNSAQFTPAQYLQRAYIEEHAAGCGICKDEKEAGKRAHTLAQSEFRVFPSITTEIPLYYPEDKENGRLDLLLARLLLHTKLAWISARSNPTTLMGLSEDIKIWHSIEVR